MKENICFAFKERTMVTTLANFHANFTKRKNYQTASFHQGIYVIVDHRLTEHFEILHRENSLFDLHVTAFSNVQRR